MLLPSRADINDKPYQSLTRVFLLSKFLLLILACLSPGPGYDTSTQLLFRLSTAITRGEAQPLPEKAIQHIASKLVRWDAIYFVSNAKDGYVYEQEWAFSWAIANVIRRLARCMEDHAFVRHDNNLTPHSVPFQWHTVSGLCRDSDSSHSSFSLCYRAV